MRKVYIQKKYIYEKKIYIERKYIYEKDIYNKKTSIKWRHIWKENIQRESIFQKVGIYL